MRRITDKDHCWATWCEHAQPCILQMVMCVSKAMHHTIYIRVSNLFVHMYLFLSVYNHHPECMRLPLQLPIAHMCIAEPGLYLLDGRVDCSPQGPLTQLPSPLHSTNPTDPRVPTKSSLFFLPPYSSRQDYCQSHIAIFEALFGQCLAHGQGLGQSTLMIKSCSRT
jgi:hypothetical protein